MVSNLIASNRSWLVIFVIFSASLSLSSLSSVHGSQSFDPNSLDELIHHYANQALSDQKTGTLHKVSLPSNFSGMDVSVVRLRSGSFWARGANVSSIYMPPRVIPIPYVKRIALVYENLGNWSSKFYQVPGYSLVAPVVGFSAFDASNSTMGDKSLGFSIMGDPVSIHFPGFTAKAKNATLKCVKFDADGKPVEFRNMSKPSVCFTQEPGHFSIVIPSPSQPPLPPTAAEEEQRSSVWKWWVAGFSVGFVGLVSLIVVGVFIVRKRRIRNMEKESEKGVALDTFWVGGDKMPSASMTRTQPALEQDYVP